MTVARGILAFFKGSSTTFASSGKTIRRWRGLTQIKEKASNVRWAPFLNCLGRTYASNGFSAATTAAGCSGSGSSLISTSGLKCAWLRA
jgi:hypothetical protein